MSVKLSGSVKVCRSYSRIADFVQIGLHITLSCVCTMHDNVTYNGNRMMFCDAGDWQIMILYDGQHVDGSPFTVRVYDPGQVKVSDLGNGVVGAAVLFPSNYQSDIKYSRPRISNVIGNCTVVQKLDAEK